MKMEIEIDEYVARLIAEYLIRELRPLLEQLAQRSANGSQLLRPAEVTKRVGLNRTSLWKLEREGKFPRHVQISEHAIAWREVDIERWILNRQRDHVTPKLPVRRRKPIVKTTGTFADPAMPRQARTSSKMPGKADA